MFLGFNIIELNIAIFVIWNIIVFAMYGIDKQNAKYGKRRISENTLLLSAALMGGTGALLGMHIFRHKTKHSKFRIGVPLLLLMNIIIILGIVYLKIFQNGQNINP